MRDKNLASALIFNYEHFENILIIILIFVNNFLKFTKSSNYFTLITEAFKESNATITVYIKNSPKCLLNLSDFKYLLEPEVCQNHKRELLALLIITSYAGHDNLRAAHRQAISQAKLSALGLQRVFLLAAIPPQEHFIAQSQLINEQQRFGDLLQGNFLEAYRNLSYKHVMGLQWSSSTHCKKAKFIIKIDDDIIYDVFQIKRYLESLEVSKAGIAKSANFLAGYVLKNKAVIRNQANKWYVSPEEYSKNQYPDYLSGWLYITNSRTAQRLVYYSYETPIFWIDDLWLTGIVRHQIGINLTMLNSWFSANSQFLECCVRDLKQHFLECEYYVGPNGGNSKLLVEFLHNVEKCYYDECSKRSKEQNLTQTCVTSYQRRLPEHGKAVVNPLKLKR
uniref:Hexosyltransferase n=1 Tax=Glossina brevipalpis TaxID=37001 RepID=A0A1A9W6C0_9MUSC